MVCALFVIDRITLYKRLLHTHHTAHIHTHITCPNVRIVHEQRAHAVESTTSSTDKHTQSHGSTKNHRGQCFAIAVCACVLCYATRAVCGYLSFAIIRLVVAENWSTSRKRRATRNEKTRSREMLWLLTLVLCGHTFITQTHMYTKRFDGRKKCKCYKTMTVHTNANTHTRSIPLCVNETNKTFHTKVHTNCVENTNESLSINVCYYISSVKKCVCARVCLYIDVYAPHCRYHRINSAINTECTVWQTHHNDAQPCVRRSVDHLHLCRLPHPPSLLSAVFKRRLTLFCLAHHSAR